MGREDYILPPHSIESPARTDLAGGIIRSGIESPPPVDPFLGYATPIDATISCIRSRIVYREMDVGPLSVTRSATSPKGLTLVDVLPRVRETEPIQVGEPVEDAITSVDDDLVAIAG